MEIVARCRRNLDGKFKFLNHIPFPEKTIGSPGEKGRQSQERVFILYLFVIKPEKLFQKRLTSHLFQDPRFQMMKILEKHVLFTNGRFGVQDYEFFKIINFCVILGCCCFLNFGRFKILNQPGFVNPSIKISLERELLKK